MSELTKRELASQAGCSEACIDAYSAAGLMPARDGVFVAGDLFRVRLIMALEEAGATLDELAGLVASGQLSFDFAGQLMAMPVALAGESSAATMQRLDLDLELVRRLRLAAGQEMIAPDRPFRRDDVEILQYVAAARDLGLSAETVINMYRLLAHAMRRTVDGMRDLFRDEVEQNLLKAGLSHREMMQKGAELRGKLQAAGLQISQILQRRFLEEAVFDNVVMRIQQVMQQAGAPAVARQSAWTVAFADLAGYTQAVQQLGDSKAHDLARLLEQLALEVCATYHGRLIKTLGDGALMTFDKADAALQACAALIAAAAQNRLLPVRAGLATGPLVMRDGDVFGRTVNLAARIMVQAKQRGISLDEATLQALPQPLRDECSGGDPVALKGFAAPSPIYHWAAPSGVR